MNKLKKAFGVEPKIPKHQALV